MRTFYLAIIAILFAATGFAQTQTYVRSSAGTYSWTVPCGVTSVYVEAWGAGAGGDYNTGGGGGGAFAAGTVTVVPGTTYTVVVGKGGIGDGSVEAGTNSSFGANLIVAEGGGRGANIRTGGRVAQSIGTIRFAGGNGAASGSGNGGSGGGGSAGASGAGGNGSAATGNAGAAGGTAGAGGGAAGGNGGSRYNDGDNGSAPGGGGGQSGASGFFIYAGNGGAGQVRITYTGISTYCEPSFSINEPITNVTFAGINNTTSATINGTPSLETFCQTGTVLQGSSYTISLKGNTNGNWKNWFRVFIDWNQNGDFTDAGEVYNIGSLQNSNGNAASTALTGTIAVPAGATVGLTKMRVLKNYGSTAANGYVGPCVDNGGDGQAEDYLIQVNSPCTATTGPTNATANGIKPLTICEGTQVILKQTGGVLGTGASWQWYTGSCGGPLTAIAVTSTDGAITVTPPVGTTTYYVRATAGGCSGASNCVSVTVTVNALPTIVLTSGSTSQNPCINGTFGNIVYTLGGGATGATLTGAPTGITGSYNNTTKQYTISGSATQSGTFNYTVTTTGAVSPCVNGTMTGTITVAPAPTSVTYSNPTIIYCTNATITSNTPSYTGGTPTNYNITPALPAGLSIDNVTGIISGSPTAVSAATTYTVTASNSCGFATGTVNIQTSAGANLYTISPNGNSAYCAGGSGVLITLPGSQNGVSYQLYRGATPVGAAVPGTGGSLSFGSQTVTGTYTIRGTQGSCQTTMTGQAVISITPLPTTTFTYPAYSYCGAGTATPVISGAPQTGTFSAATGLVIDAATGVINLAASTPGSYSISYTVPATGGCSVYTYTNPTTFKINPSPLVFSVYGGGSYCSGGAGVEIGLEGSQTGINYQLYLGAATSGAPVAGTGADISFGNRTAAGTYTVVATTAASPFCQATMTGSATITVNPLPAAIVITPSSNNFCQGNIVSLSASGTPPTPASGSVTFPSGTIALDIPNDNTNGISSLLRVDGIPAGATITSVSVNFNVVHSYDGDLIINLKGPNGNVLNIANGIGGTGDDFTNTTVASNASTQITTASPAYTGTYLPQGALSVTGAQIVTSNVSNVANFSGLYGASSTSANGNWILSVRDKEDHRYFFDLFSYEDGQTRLLNNWTITVNYTTVSNNVAVKWSPVTDLYTDPAATVPYTAGTLTNTVYSNPASAGSVVYTATSTNATNCTSSATATLTVKPSPVLAVTGDYCSTPGSVKITASSNIAINNWTWSNGLGSGTVSGNTSAITPNSAGTFFVTATSTGNNCATTSSLSIAQELVINGDFENGNTGFTSGYTYVAATTANGLQPSGTYTINNTPNFNHTNFWGADHTKGNGEGKFMLVNGTTGPIVWQQTVTVLPNTVYYFSAYATSLNNLTPYANLRFNVNGSQVGTSTGALPTKASNNNPGTWVRFYGTWNSGSNTSATIQIVDLENSATGNDFGLDDISFGTLSTFLNLTSETNTNNQTICADAPLSNLTYEVGGNGSIPIVTGLPAGLTTYWNGREMSIKGTPTAYGTFNYQIRAEVCSGAFLSRTGTLTITAPSKAGNFAAPIASACYNTAGSIAVTGTVGTVSKWQSSTSPVTSWSDISNTTSTLNYPAQTTAMTYRLIAVNGTGCKADTSATVKVGIKNLWTGTTSAAWNTASNWSDEAIPTTTCPSVIIPVVGSNIYPSITSGTTDVVNIDVKTGASLIINGGTLRVSGTITSTGGIDAKEGTIVLNGTSTQTIAGANLKDKTVKNLTIQNNVSLTPSTTDTLKIGGTLGFGTASGKTFAAGTNNVVLLSSRANTANVPNLGSNTITGSKFTVERYVNTGAASVDNPLAHGRAWQLLSVPTNTTQSIHNAWQEGQGANADNLKGYGAILNGPVAQGGYDNNSAGTYIKSYIPAADQWTLGNGTNAPIATKRGWMTFIMGDRSSNATNSKPTVLRTTGSLFTGTQPTLSVTANKYEVIGNPYASEIDLRELIKPSNNLTQQVYVWDPSLGAGFGFGRYRTLTFEDGDYYTIPASANYPEISNTIQSGQAFFVKSNGQGPSSVTFTEAVKSNNNHVVTRGGASAAEKLRIDLSITQSGTHTLLDGAIAFFKNEYSINADETDGAKLLNSGENAGFKTGGKYLSVDRRPSPVSADTLFVEMTGMKAQAYNWEVTTANMNKPGRNAWLLDNYLGTKTPLSLDGNTNVSFDVTSVAASAAANRFSIIFSKIAGPLPVTFTGISANRNSDRSIAVKWSVENEVNLDKYTVERSADGANFTGIITADVTNSRNYAKNDLSPLAQENYYRIKATSLNGQVQYSAIVKVAPVAVTVTPSISVYPNPVEDKTMNLSFVNQASGTYQLQLINDLGQVMYSGSVKVNGTNDRKQVKLQTIKATGRYTLKVVAEDGTASSIQLLIQ